MALTKQNIVDAITLRDTGHVEIRTSLVVFDDDGSEILRKYSRRTISPEDDITGEPLKIRQICNIARS